MIHAISKSELLRKHPQLFNKSSKFISTFAFSFQSESYDAFLEELSLLMKNLLLEFHSKYIAAIPETKFRGINFDGDSNEIVDARNYFSTVSDTKQWEGLMIFEGDVREFLKHLFWITRLKASTPIINFIDENNNFIGNLCQYKHIHISTLNMESDKLFKEKVSRGLMVISSSGK